MHPSKEEFFKGIYWDNEFRIENKRNLVQDYKQWNINESLRKNELNYIEKFKEGHNYPIFIVGAPRSGSTLLSQLLVKSFDLASFYNGISKYYQVPIVGLIKEGITDVDKNNIVLNSYLGNTKGDFSPHEFGYFWQYWLNHQVSDELSEIELSKIDWIGLRNHINAYANYLGKPLLIKNLVFNNFIIEKLSETFPNAKFIHIVRNPIYSIQSILQARNLRYNNINLWWSIRPKHFMDWQIKYKPISQVVRQVEYTKGRVNEELKKLDKRRVLNVNYEDLGNELIIKMFEDFLGLVSIKKMETITIRNKWNESDKKRLELINLIEKVKIDLGFS